MRHRAGSSRCIARCSGSIALAAVVGCGDRASSTAAPSYAEARAVVEGHCISCHSEQPTIPAFPIAPSGVVFDTAEQMQRYAERIRVRTVVDRTMPLLNKSGMTDRERAVLAGWIEAGAKRP